jgi:hypothetical protein
MIKIGKKVEGLLDFSIAMLKILFKCSENCTANEGPVRIQYKRLVQIYVFPEMKMRGIVISKTELLCSVS